MNKPLSLIVLLLAAALLLPGCNEEPGSDTGPELLSEDELEGVPIESTDVDQEGASEDQPQSIPVVDDAAITALRKQAAAQGKVLVIDCWATYCSSCVAMFPHLHQAMKKRGDDVMLVSLSFDEGESSIKKAGQFLTEQDAWHNAYLAKQGSDAKDRIAQALSETWNGGALPAVFVYKPDGTTAYELLEIRGGVKDWVAQITAAVDKALQTADDSPGQ